VKLVKAVGGLAALALFAMALLGPSLAMGEDTALCGSDEESECSSPMTHIHSEAKDLEVLTSAINYHCKALFLAEVTELGAPQSLVGNFTFTNCSGGCSRTEENGPTTLYLLKNGVESAEVTGEGSEIHVDCGLAMNCSYSFENLTGFAKGPLLSKANNGEISWLEQEITHTSGLFCPSLAKLDAELVPLSPAYISS
jgi:hypothetical protein